MDMGDKDKRIYIEYDGILHFKSIYEESFDKTRKKDQEIEQYFSECNWTLIRVSYDQYVDKNKIEKSYFLPECLDKIIEILNGNVRGIYKIGKAYDEH